MKSEISIHCDVVGRLRRTEVTYYGGYNTALGGSAYCGFTSAVTDRLGAVYGSGLTIDFPNITQGGHQNTYGGGSRDALLVKFDNDGFRLWATYYGGSGGEVGGVSSCVDNLNNVYIAGNTGSSNGIAFNGFQNSLIGTAGAFIVKFNPAGVRQWGTYFGTVGTQVRGMCYDSLSWLVHPLFAVECR